MKNVSEGMVKMYAVKTLAELKRAVQKGKPYEILRHYIKEDWTGQIRIPNVVQSNGWYSVVMNKPNHPQSQANYGKGVWLDYGKATDWIFTPQGTCKRLDKDRKHVIMEIKFLNA